MATTKKEEKKNFSVIDFDVQTITFFNTLADCAKHVKNLYDKDGIDTGFFMAVDMKQNITYSFMPETVMRLEKN